MYCRDPFEHLPTPTIPRTLILRRTHVYQTTGFLSPFLSNTSACLYQHTLSFDRLPHNSRGYERRYSLANTLLSHSLSISGSNISAYDPPAPALGSIPKAHNVKLTTAPLTPFATTLTKILPIPSRHAPASPLFATLTNTPSRKPFRYHSYEKHRGVGVSALPPQALRLTAIRSILKIPRP
jgi:hypothetical protein